MMIMFTFALIVVFAQDEGAATTGESGGNNFVTEAITNYTIDTFEAANTWTASIPRDYGIATLMRREGYVNDVREENPDASDYILSLKVEFFRTGNVHFSIKPPRKINIPGTVKDLSVWVAGRNYEHTMSFYISDALGQIHSVGNNKLNFIGWKKVSSYISPTVVQEDIHTQTSGIDFLGMRVVCDPKTTRGKYFVYFDNLAATTDLYLDTYSSPDDPKDIW